MKVKDALLRLADEDPEANLFTMHREYDIEATVIRSATTEEATTSDWLDAAGEYHRGLPGKAVLIC